MASLIPRRIAGAVSALVLGTVAATATAAPAHAEDGYQYWNYFHLVDGAWAFAEEGPADYTPEDGDVEGYRYGTSTVSQGIEPRADLDEVNFEAICGDTTAADGEKRVGLVLDYGSETDQGEVPDPRAECAVVAQDATTMQILQGSAELRLDSGMTCGIDGYPASGCGVPVKDATIPSEEEPVAFALPDTGEVEATATEADGEDEDSLVWPLAGAAALVVLVGGGALLLNRRRTA